MGQANQYAIPEIARRYDALSVGRRDLPFYVAVAQQLGAESVVDLGAGTGLLCSMLVRAGVRRVVGVDPQEVMLAIAREQPMAERVEWIRGTAADLPAASADLVVMTGHVAQYFLDDSAWENVLVDVAEALTPGGTLAFEVRNPAREAWSTWNDDIPRPVPGGSVRTTTTMVGDLATHVDEWRIDGHVFRTSETLRFPDEHSIDRGLERAGLRRSRTWGDWDGSAVNPSSPEWIILATAVPSRSAVR